MYAFQINFLTILWTLRGCKMQLDATYHINTADDSLDNRGFIHRCLFFCSASETTHAHLEAFLSRSKYFGVDSVKLECFIIKQSREKFEEHLTTLLIFSLSLAAQRDQTWYTDKTKDRRKTASVLCRTHVSPTCQSITVTPHLFEQSQEIGSYLPDFYFRYNVHSISFRTCHWDILFFFSFHFPHSKCHQPSLPDSHVTLKKASDSQTLIFFSSTLGMYKTLSGPASVRTTLFRFPWLPWTAPRTLRATSQPPISARQGHCHPEPHLLLQELVPVWHH